MISRRFFYICFLYLFLKDLFLQPSPNQIDDFLSGWLREREDAGKMRTAMTHIDMQVLLVLGEWQSIDA